MKSGLQSPKAAKHKENGANAAGENPSHFFQKQLAGEEPLSWGTSERLILLASKIFAIQPWDFLADQDLFLLRDPRSSVSASVDLCYCSVMGALGEVFSLQIYLGTESYRSFRYMADGGRFTSAGEFLSRLTGISVEFVPLGEVTPADRQMLKSFGYPLQRGASSSPIFRALRPGFQPWYVNESEGYTLAECMQALVALCQIVQQNRGTAYWEEKDLFPLFMPLGEPGPERKYAVEMLRLPAPPPAIPQPPALDAARMQKLKQKDYPVKGCLEVDLFYPPSAVGGKDERKAFVTMVMVADAASGFLFSPELATAAQPIGESLAKGLMKAMETARSIPAELRIKKEEYKALLNPLAQQLGIPIRVMRALPNLDQASNSIFSMMAGGPLF